jgi:hypothetical protein
MATNSRSSGLYAGKETAEEALRLALPLLERAVSDASMGQSGVLHVVLMDPSRHPGSCPFEEAILLEHSVGKDRSAWDADYAWYARAKAKVSWRTQRDGHAVRALSPHLLRHDDTPLWGSVALDGIVVGVSGAEAAYDEALAGVVALLFRAVIKKRAGDPKP